MNTSRLPRERLVRLMVALALALPLVFSYVAHAVQPRLGSLVGQVLFGIYLALLLTPLAHRVLFRYALPRLRVWSRRARLLWGGVAVGLSLLLLRPLPAATFPQHHQLEIVALGQRNPAAQASQVWLIDLVRADGMPVGFNDLERQGTWQLENGWLRTEEAQAALRWSGTLAGGGKLRFVAHPWSGVVRVSWDGQPQVIDLYADAQAERMVELPDSGWDDPLSRALRLLALVSDGLSLTMLILLGLIWLFDRSNGAPGIGMPGWWMLATVLCTVVWSLYLLAFWPGLLNVDVADQWQQMVRWQIYNEHPAAHTLTLWLITRFWFSPAAVVLVQMLALALVFGLIVRELRLWGVPSLVLGVLTVAMAGSFVNGMMVVTLWKDTLFSIALLAVFGLLLGLVRSHGGMLASRPWQLGLLVGLLLVALYRHNGPPVVVGLMICLGLFYPVFRRQLLALGAALLFGYLLITGPVYRHARVVPTSSYFALQMLMHQIGSVVSSGAPLDAETAAFLAQIQPLDSWKRNYDCYTLSPLVYSPEANSPVVNERPDELVRVWFRLAIDNIPTLIRHQLCVTSLIWQVDEPPGVTIVAGITESADLARQYGLQTASLLPGLHDRLVALHRWSTEPGQIWWIWRPALYLYLLLGTVIALALRRRDRQLLVLALPGLISSLVWLALITVNDTRFQYAVYLMGLVVLVLPFARPLPSAVHEQSDAR